MIHHDTGWCITGISKLRPPDYYILSFWNSIMVTALVIKLLITMSIHERNVNALRAEPKIADLFIVANHFLNHLEFNVMTP